MIDHEVFQIWMFALSIVRRMIDDVGYAHDCDSSQFVTSMTGFSLHGDLIVC